jgi:hypothetical protein
MDFMIPQFKNFRILQVPTKTSKLTNDMKSRYIEVEAEIPVLLYSLHRQNSECRFQINNCLSLPPEAK